MSIIELFGDGLAWLRLLSYLCITFVFAWKMAHRHTYKPFHFAMTILYVGALLLSASALIDPSTLPLWRALQTPASVAAAVFGIMEIYKEVRAHNWPPK